jgi:hypothetical protein
MSDRQLIRKVLWRVSEKGVEGAKMHLPDRPS